MPAATGRLLSELLILSVALVFIYCELALYLHSSIKLLHIFLYQLSLCISVYVLRHYPSLPLSVYIYIYIHAHVGA